MTYVEAQALVKKIPYNEDTYILLNKFKDYLHDSYRRSIQTQDWINCADPNLSDYSYWSHDREIASNEKGVMRWEWKQPKNQNIVYLFTEKREKNEKGEYETKKTVSYKNLTLTHEAVAFFSGINV